MLHYILFFFLSPKRPEMDVKGKALLPEVQVVKSTGERGGGNKPGEGDTQNAQLSTRVSSIFA